ncbi:hypothetical protein [Alkalilimnicola sp. S0819]|uniref:DUF7931 domain-containing protein n=1 Tax=Alkalilimnicola sp. S0819 TaxID=2613922 RepID=UPI0012626FF5|nr:hypothetical protein [Alkalilimnicola sp. S0819]KAB7627569.1 hypothetical protein F3N43_03660 [Alkalilimnicola sp. S0819]MPQ15726.1 hypothetical protein [Alkalilimnicola sp. S0819]
MSDIQTDQGPRRLDSLGALREATDELLQGARLSVDLLSRDLEPALLDREPVRQALRDLCTGSRRAQVRILLQDSTRAIKEGHSLVELARRLSSFMEIRLLGPEHQAVNDALLIVDRRGYIRRESGDRPEGIAERDSPARAVELGEEFQRYWDASVADPNLRRLHL